MDYTRLLADRTAAMGASAIREILKVVQQPGMISLAGGIPAAESFPLEIIEELTRKVIGRYGAEALQYDRTEGFIPLQKTLSDYVLKKGIKAKPDDIIITCGSQGVLDSIGKILVSRGDSVAVEAPTYLGALQALNPYGPEYRKIETDDNGIIPAALEKIAAEGKIKFVYLVPTFQNPTGRTVPEDRRREIAAILRRYDVLLVEDDPYADLRYRGSAVPAIKTLAPEHVVYTSTLSKIFAPGLRIGYCIAPEPVRHWLVLAKQGIDLHTSTFNQALAAEYLEGGYLERQLPKIISIYKPRFEAMLRALGEYFPEDFVWSKPEGGMFIWAQGSAGRDMEKIYYRCIDRKVAFVPGKYFFTEKGEGMETMRLNFSMQNPDTIDRAVKIIGEVLK